MIIMFLISLVLLLLVIPNLKVKRRTRYSNWDRWADNWEYLGRYKIAVWKYIIIFLITLIPIVNIISVLVVIGFICFPREYKGSESYDFEEKIIYLEGGLLDKFRKFLNKKI